MADLSSLSLHEVRASYSRLIAYYEKVFGETTSIDLRLAIAKHWQSCLGDYLRLVLLSENEMEIAQVQRILASKRAQLDGWDRD